MLNLRKYNFRKDESTDMKLLAEAEEQGFLYGHTKYNKKFNSLFFEGGITLDYKKDLTESEIKNMGSYLVRFMTSYSPKHEHKEAICALVLSQLIEIE